MKDSAVEQYLQKLGLHRQSPDLNFLTSIQRRHLERIPFENLDIHYGNRILLDIPKIANKILSSNRGGYCFELNGLLYHLLTALGFECYMSSAQFFKEDGSLSAPMDHMLLAVEIKNTQYLVDVGLTDGFHGPKEIKMDKMSLDNTRYYRFDFDPDDNVILEVSKDASTFKKFYVSDLKPTHFIEFLDVNNKHQEDANSYFRQQKIVTKISELGERTTLTDRKLSYTEGGELFEFDILNEDEFLSKLEQHFNIPSSSLIQ